MTDYNKYDDRYLYRLDYEDTYSMLGGIMTQAFSTGRGMKEKREKRLSFIKPKVNVD